MSRQLKELGGLTVSEFWGGERRGHCIQITARQAPDGYAQLTRRDVAALVVMLVRWLARARANNPAK
jgi:hypothetical protein